MCVCVSVYSAFFSLWMCVIVMWLLHIWWLEHMHTYKHDFMQTYVHECMYKCMHGTFTAHLSMAHTHTHVHTYAWMHLFIHTHTHICIFTYRIAPSTGHLCMMKGLIHPLMMVKQQALQQKTKRYGFVSQLYINVWLPLIHTYNCVLSVWLRLTVIRQVSLKYRQESLKYLLKMQSCDATSRVLPYVW